MRSLLLAALALMAASCTGCHPTPPPVTPTAGDAGAAADAAPAPAPAPPAVVTCTAADAHRRSLGCADQSFFLALCLNVNDQRFADCIAGVTGPTPAAACKAMDGCDPALLAGAKRHP